MDRMTNYIGLAWKLVCMLRTYRTYNSVVRLLKYEFNNKLLGNITLFRVTLGVIWTHLSLSLSLSLYIYIYTCISKNPFFYIDSLYSIYSLFNGSLLISQKHYNFKPERYITLEPMCSQQTHYRI